MKGWWKCPSGRASDVRWASLTFSARGLLATIEDMADGEGWIPLVSGLEGLAEVLGGRHGADVAEPLLVELIGAGLVAIDDDARRLVIVQGPTDTAALDSAVDGPVAPHDGTTAAPEAPAGTSRPAAQRARVGRPRAPNPLGLAAADWRRLKYCVEHRVGRFARLPEGTTITALLDPASPWRALLKSDGRATRYSDASRTSEKSNSDASRTLVGRNSDALPPAPPNPRESREETGETRSLSDAGARDGEQVGRKSDATATLATATPERVGVATATSCATVERVGAGMVAGEVLMLLRGEARLRLTTTTQQERELERVLVDVAARGQGWERAGLDRLAGHLRDGHATTRDGSAWRPTLAQLRGHDGAWARLLSLYDEASSCARCDGGHGPDGWDNSEDLASVRRRRREQAERGA